MKAKNWNQVYLQIGLLLSNFTTYFLTTYSNISYDTLKHSPKGFIYLVAQYTIVRFWTKKRVSFLLQSEERCEKWERTLSMTSGLFTAISFRKNHREFEYLEINSFEILGVLVYLEKCLCCPRSAYFQQEEYCFIVSLNKQKQTTNLTLISLTFLVFFCGSPVTFLEFSGTITSFLLPLPSVGKRPKTHLQF